jgi:hypothetical protein
MVAYSFGGFVLKSLVVEMYKHVYQKQMINLDVKTQNCCENFLKNMKGMVFYSVPHGAQVLSHISSGNVNKSPRIKLDHVF